MHNGSACARKNNVHVLHVDTRSLGSMERALAGRELQTDVPWEHNVEAECAPTELPNSFQYITKRINNFKVRSSHSRTVACWAAGGDEVMTGLVLHTRGERGR